MGVTGAFASVCRGCGSKTTRGIYLDLNAEVLLSLVGIKSNTGEQIGEQIANQKR
jgi:hypothetical protein